jgi:peptidyl-prolyl cis-trans isomerase C
MQKLLVAGLLVTALTVVGCGKGSDSTVIAKIGSTKITVADFKKQIDALPPQMQQAVAADPKARKDFLNDLIGVEVVLQEAKRQGLDKDAEFKKKQEQYRKDMERQIEEGVKNELFNSLLKKEIANKVTVPTDQEVKEYYAQHKNEMRSPDGKVLSFKVAEPQLKSWLFQKKQREVYLAYAQGLKAKAKITIDDKALDALSNTLSQPSVQQGLQMQHPGVPGEKK